MNLASNLDAAVSANPDKTAIIFGELSLSYQAFNQYVNQVANALLDMGITRGDAVALSCPNIPFFPIVYYGVLKAGATIVPLNVLLKATEIQYHLEDSGAKAYFCFEGNAGLPVGKMGLEAFEQVPACEHFTLLMPSLSDTSSLDGVQSLGELIADKPTTFDTVDCQDDDSAVVLYTSGTTGQPKGAELTHYNMRMNAKGATIFTHYQQDDVSLITLPLFHSFGQTVLMNATVAIGGTMVLIARFEPGHVLEQIQTHGVSVFAGVPTMYIALLNFRRIDDYDIAAIAARMRIAISGGSSLPVEVIKQFEETFDVAILEGYGLSETSPVATFNHLENPRIPGSIGQPIQGVEVKVVDDNGVELPPGEKGEIVIKGHNVMKGYLNRPEATAETIIDGWFHSGDIGTMDEQGNFYIVDRLKEMIIRGGFNVYPREIEEALMEHEDVVMVAVIGVPHETHGEEIKAYVVSRNGFDDARALRIWAKQRLADYKYPRLIEFREELPMNATGKLQKKALKAELENQSSQ